MSAVHLPRRDSQRGAIAIADRAFGATDANESPTAIERPRERSDSHAGIAIWQVVTVAAAAVIPYLNSLGDGFAFDDFWHFVENPLVQLRDPIAALYQTYEPGPVYRPWAILSFQLDELLGGTAFGYHATNLLLHAAVSVVVFLIARQILLGRRVQAAAPGAFLTALVFALHPVHTEAVTSIVGRFELLAALAAFSSLAAFARSLRAGRGARAWYWLSVAAAAIGPFAKENALAVLPMLFLLHLWLRPDARWSRRALLLLPHALALLPYLAIRIVVTGALVLPHDFPLLDNPLAPVSAPVRIATAIIVLWRYVGLLVFPHILSADYSYNEIPAVTTPGDPRLLVALLGFTALAAVIAAYRRRLPVLPLSAAFAAVTIALTSNLPFAIGTMMGERLLYLPSFAFCLAAGWLAAIAYQRHPAIGGPLLCAVLVLYGFRTWERNEDWRDNETLFRATVVTSPYSAKAHYNLGVAYFRRGAHAEAAREFGTTLRIYPQYSAAAYSLGAIAEMAGHLDDAVRWYEHAMALEWNCFRAHKRLGALRFRIGELTAAEAAFRTALEEEPNDPYVLLYLAATRAQQGALWDSARLVRQFDAIDWIAPEDRSELKTLRKSVLQEWPK